MSAWRRFIVPARLLREGAGDLVRVEKELVHERRQLLEAKLWHLTGGASARPFTPKTDEPPYVRPGPGWGTDRKILSITVLLSSSLRLASRSTVARRTIC